MTLKRTLFRWINSTGPGNRFLGARALRLNSDLLHQGWFESFRAGLPVDARGEPLPWYTYPAIRFIGERVQPGMTVFEYGSGNSTLWWGRRVAQVCTCEHDRAWHDAMQPRFPSNVDAQFAPLDDSGLYADAAVRSGRQYDVIVIDGRQRVQCARSAMRALKPGGVMIWDNSERDEYAPGQRSLQEAGFRRIDFWGMGPINTYGWSTSVFYRDGNCFGL
jgi:hypothetical protein